MKKTIIILIMSCFLLNGCDVYQNLYGNELQDFPPVPYVLNMADGVDGFHEECYETVCIKNILVRDLE